jgi:ABC-2 type transport system ATP-binding protein
MLSGLVYPSKGEISVLGFTPFDRKRDFLMQIGLVMGNKAGLNWDLTPSQSFNLLRQIYGIPKDVYEERINRLTTLLSTEKFLNTQVRKLSLGERMKMELIGAILHSPKVLFLDEPTIGLDIISKQKIRDFLREIQRTSKITILLTSHDMDDVEKVCDRVIVITEGQKVYDDSISKLTAEYQKFRYVTFVFIQKPEKIQTNCEVIEENSASITLKVKSEEMPNLVGEFTQKYQLDDINIISTPLEEIISDIFKKNDGH